MRQSKSQSAYLMDLVKKTIDLKVFVEREGLTTLRQEGRSCWKGKCPLHKDSDPSFGVYKMDDGVWVYHCFGCSSGGTIIDFCMELKGILNAYEAVVFIAKLEGLKCDSSLIVKASKEAQIRTDEQNNTNLAHFVASENCRRLLRLKPGDEQIMRWAAKSFSAMNKLLDDPTTRAESFRPFREEACRKMSEICKLK